MGVSSDAMLYFGFAVGEDDEPPEWLGENEDGDCKDFDDFIVEKSGMSLDAPYADRHKVIDACPAELYLYCSYNYPMYILGVRGAEHRVSRGYSMEIGLADLGVKQENICAFRDWCSANGIPYQEPKWILCSMYG